MKKGAIVTFALSVACFLTLAANAQPPGGDKGGKGGPGGAGGFRPPQPGEILPGFLQERLKLTDDQKAQLAVMQKDVNAKLDKLLTADQKAQLKTMRGPGGDKGGNPGGDKGGPGGDKGGPGGDKGGKGGPGGDKGAPGGKGASGKD